jgi:ligand-binding sensor domain-containing protein
MTIKTAKADFVSDEVVEEVAQMLRSLKTPDEFVILASRWLSSCLYKNYRLNGSPAPPYQTLKEILTDVLDEMDAENHEYAKILRSRFWKGSIVKEIILDSPWSARTFFSLQNKAIRLYAFLLVQKEEACRQSNRKNRLINAGRSFLTRANPPRENLLKRNGLILTMGLVILALTVALIWSISGTSQDHRISQPDPTASEAVDVAQPEVSSGLGSDVPVQSLLVNGSLETSRSSLCGGDLQVSASQAERFIRSQGVSAFTVDNTAGGVLSDRIRTLVNGPGGLWIGYFDEGSHRGGLGHYDKKSWVECSTTEFDLRQNINTLISDEHGNLWIGFEEGGVAHFDGRNWRRYTTLDGLPSDKVYGLTIDSAGLLWVGTWEGIARFDGETWTVPYNARNDTIFNDHVHAVAFDSNNNIWVGHIRAGVSHYQQEGGKWVSYTTKSGHLGGDQIRSIMVRPAGVDYPESIWFASSDGGISKYEQGEWRIYQIQNGLPGNDVRGLALDRYNRVWAVTGKGVVYLEDEVWKTYSRTPLPISIIRL